MAREVREGFYGPAYLPGLQVWGSFSAGNWTLEKRALPPQDRQWVQPLPLAGKSLDRLCAACCSSQGTLSGGCDDRSALRQLLCLARQAWLRLSSLYQKRPPGCGCGAGLVRHSRCRALQLQGPCESSKGATDPLKEQAKLCGAQCACA